MSATPVFASADLLATAAITPTANTNHDGTTGTYSTVFTGTNGVPQRIDAIGINASAAAAVTTQGKIRFFITTDGNPANKRKLGELNVPPLTPSASQSGFSDTWYPPRPVAVPDANTIIYANTNQGEAFVAIVFGSKLN